MSQPPSTVVDALELGHLLATTVASVVGAQEELDQYTLRRAREFETAAPGSLAIPPLWFTFREAEVEVELSASVTRAGTAGGAPALACRLLNPTSVGLFGYQASSGLRVRVVVAPRGFAEIVPAPSQAPREPA